MQDLKERTIRGGSARGLALAANFLIRVASLTVLARLLEPRDFGLLGMVTAFTGILSLFRDFGLSSAAVQRPTVTNEQSSTLFWINLVVGGLLALISASFAPLVSSFYHEPRLLWVTVVVAVSFFFNGAGVQHSVLLQRQMRFTALAVIDLSSWILSNAMAIAAAKAGYGLWALVLMTVVLPLTNTIGLWIAAAWVPGKPRRGVDIRSMTRFGGTLTLNGLVMYIASNCEKVLLGRFWGAQALGIYGRAFQLIRIPTDNLNSAVGEVAFSALSRIQDDPPRLRRYFLKGYSLVLALTLPITVACALFADDMVFVLLGPKWTATATIFRLLAPTMMVFAIANPLGWLLNSIGFVARGLKIALVIGPLMVVSYAIGLPYGPAGVAFAYSAVMMLWIFPVIVWCVHGTVVSVRDVLVTVGRPLASIAPAAILAFSVKHYLLSALSPFPRLCAEDAILFLVYALVLLFVAGQKSLYLELFRGFRARAANSEEQLASDLPPGTTSALPVQEIHPLK
jgi:O-antigen/teichoic acid export membrane protein